MATASPLISFVIASHNNPQRLSRVLDKLRTVTASFDCEIFICENSKLPTSPCKLKKNEYFLPSPNGNEGTLARTRGIAQATAPVLCLMDDDAWPVNASDITLAVERLHHSPDHIAGLIPRVVLPDGSLQATLFPRVPLGCAVFVRTAVFRQFNGAYPRGFIYYGEEYWQSLLLWKHGLCFNTLAESVFQHCPDQSGGNKARVFYYLTRNNAAIWQRFIPQAFRETVLADTNERYRLLSLKENVHHAYLDGIQKAQEVIDANPGDPLSLDAFKQYAFLDEIAALPLRDKKILMCGAGKFPTLWRTELLRAGAGHVAMTDRNPGLQGRSYNGIPVLREDEALSCLKEGYHALVGHCSLSDNAFWWRKLRTLSLPADRILCVGRSVDSLAFAPYMP